MPIRRSWSDGKKLDKDQGGYQWLYYTDPCAATGTAPDLKTAERRVAELCRSAEDASMGHAA